MSQFLSSLLLVLSLIFSVYTSPARALDLDWHGQFRTETNWIYGYSHNRLLTTALATTDQGYFIPLNGDSPASFQNLFLRLTPRVIVSDNVSIYSNLWFGSPDRGIFGGNQVTTSTVNQTNTGNATISANTFYAEVATDFGTLVVGRLPLNWGLGVIWNHSTDGFDRMPSTGDGFRLETKLGAFKFAPAVYKYRAGTNYGGSGTVAGTNAGNSTATDYSLALTYNNDDEQMDLGLLFLRRLAGMQAAVTDPFSLTGTNTGYAFNVWDFYATKKTGIFTISAEVPIVTGLVGSKTYSTVAGAMKVDTQLNDQWKIKLNGGLAGGQDSLGAGASAAKLTAFSFHPDYRPGLLMFNYNYRNLSDGSLSPFNNPVTNAQFVALGFDYNSNKWTYGFNWVYATASKSADGTAGGSYYNTWDGHYKSNNAGATAQEKGLGTEFDWNIGYDWDESLKFGLNMGLYFPGKFYEFSNSATLNETKTVFGMGMNLLVKF
jgi:hypothetical protein